MTDWQLIETAPKDRTEILLFFARDNQNFEIVMSGYWSSDIDDRTWRVFGWVCPFDIDNNPTHWMTLPEPPKGDE